VLAGSTGHATPEYVAELRRAFGLDRPLWEQFAIFVWRLVRLDLGYSFVHRQPVGALVLERLGPTVLLMATAIALAIALGVVAGVTAARRPRSWLDTLISVGALLVYATPAFWLGLMLIVLFSVRLDLLPSGGMEDVRGLLGMRRTLDILRHLVLPAVTLALFYVAVYTRLMRAAMLEVAQLEYVTTARAKGLSETAVVWKHAARNALLPVVTLAGLQFGHLLGGSVLIETVFGWPGLGRLVFDALLQRDLNLLLGILFVSSVVVVLANLAVDLLYGLLDPRISQR
jgi:peptide/nickel transport system permease protein